jgi:hypothetical protein
MRATFRPDTAARCSCSATFTMSCPAFANHVARLCLSTCPRWRAGLTTRMRLRSGGSCLFVFGRWASASNRGWIAVSTGSSSKTNAGCRVEQRFCTEAQESSEASRNTHHAAHVVAYPKQTVSGKCCCGIETLRLCLTYGLSRTTEGRCQRGVKTLPLAHSSDWDGRVSSSDIARADARTVILRSCPSRCSRIYLSLGR